MVDSNEKFLSLKLHEKCIIDEGEFGTWLDCRRVPNGWIYSTFHNHRLESEIFVPYSKEFK